MGRKALGDTVRGRCSPTALSMERYRPRLAIKAWHLPRKRTAAVRHRNGALGGDAGYAALLGPGGWLRTTWVQTERPRRSPVCAATGEGSSPTCTRDRPKEVVDLDSQHDEGTGRPDAGSTVNRPRPKAVRVREEGSGRAPAVITVNGRLAVTTEEAAKRRGIRPDSMRKWIERHGVDAAGYVDDRTPVYYPSDLGLPEKE